MKPRIPSALLAVPFLLTNCATRRLPESFPEDSPASAETRAGAIAAPKELSPDSAPSHFESEADEANAPSGQPPSMPDPAPNEIPPTGHEGHEDGKRADPPASPGPELYICPMHPEVTSAAPGTCPKCGMQLEKNP